MMYGTIAIAHEIFHIEKTSFVTKLTIASFSASRSVTQKLANFLSQLLRGN